MHAKDASHSDCSLAQRPREIPAGFIAAKHQIGIVAGLHEPISHVTPLPSRLPKLDAGHVRNDSAGDVGWPIAGHIGSIAPKSETLRALDLPFYVTRCCPTTTRRSGSISNGLHWIVPRSRRPKGGRHGPESDRSWKTRHQTPRFDRRSRHSTGCHVDRCQCPRQVDGGRNFGRNSHRWNPRTDSAKAHLSRQRLRLQRPRRGSASSRSEATYPTPRRAAARRLRSWQTSALGG